MKMPAPYRECMTLEIIMSVCRVLRRQLERLSLGAGDSSPLVIVPGGL